MPDALEQFARETIEELLRELPAKERLKGLSPDDLLAALSPEFRAALAQRLRDYGPAQVKGAEGSGQGDRNP